LRLPDDDRMLVTIHYYAPMQFTHQGAQWLANAEQWVGTVWGTEDDRDAVSRDLTQAAAWARASDLPLLVGEFGTYERADLPSRQRWTEWVRREAERLALSWCYWEFRNGLRRVCPASERVARAAPRGPARDRPVTPHQGGTRDFHASGAANRQILATVRVIPDRPPAVSACSAGDSGLVWTHLARRGPYRLAMCLVGIEPTVVTAATGSSTLFKVADAVAALKVLPAAYRSTAAWIMHPDDAASLAGTTDPAGLLAIQSMSFSPPSLLGLLVFVDGNLPAPAANAKSAVIGSWKDAYAVRRVNSVLVQRLDELHSDLGQVGYRAIARSHGRILLPDAARILAHSAT
jgi:hypothetical protein